MANTKNKTSKDIRTLAAKIDQPNSKATVLIADNVKFMRMALGRMVKSAGYAVIEAEDAIEVLKILREETIDLLITDIKMPGMDGLEMIKKIRASTKTAGLPIIICTASKEKEDILRAAQLGVQGFLIKPISPSTLLTKKLDEIFSGSRKCDETPLDDSNIIDI